MPTAPIERTTRYATTVDDLPAAWGFVMDHIEAVGPDPEVTISPMWTVTLDLEAEAPARQFTVVVSGMVEVEA